MPKLLHESLGLKIVKNDVNSFAIASLHHTADPAKRSPEWRREASAGLTPEKFAREYDIDYSAVLGSKVFPEITQYKPSIVTEPIDFGRDTRYWGGFDYGLRNPSSFHVYTIRDGIVYSIFEVFHPCQNIPSFADEMRTFPYWKQIRYIVADPSLWSPVASDGQLGGITSLYEMFTKAGIRQLVKGRNDAQAEESWIAMMRNHWRNPDDISFKISEACPNQVREFETCVYIGQSERQLLTSAYRETIADVDNHSLDDCKYFLLSKPSQQLQDSWKDPNMISRWAIPSSQHQSSYSPSSAGRKPVGGYV